MQKNFRDPNLWLVKCRIGEERQTAIQLMRKFIAFQFSDEVFSAHDLKISYFIFSIPDK